MAFIEGASNATFLLACACERIVLAPSATLTLQALSSEGLFFKDLLGELGVSPELDAVGEFKSAGEIFEQRRSSEPHRREMKSILEDMNEQFVRHIAEGRGITTDAAAAAVAAGPHMAQDAKRAGLVDELGYEDSCDTLFEEAIGPRAKRVEYTRYGSPGWLGRVARWRRPRVAVLHVVGVLRRESAGRRPRPTPCAKRSRSSDAIRAYERSSCGSRALEEALSPPMPFTANSRLP